MTENKFNEFVEIVKRLRKECPWDREQTNDSIKAATIEEVYEPFLIQEGFIRRTPRGREVTDSAYEHLGIQKRKKSRTAPGQDELF